MNILEEIQALFATFFNFVLGLIANILPNSNGLPTGISNAITTFAGYLNSWGGMFPVNTLFTVITTVILFEVGVIMFKFVKFILNLFRGAGG